jgi:hypothetical protein
LSFTASKSGPAQLGETTLGGEETLADNLTWEEIQGLFE